MKYTAQTCYIIGNVWLVGSLCVPIGVSPWFSAAMIALGAVYLLRGRRKQLNGQG